MDSEPPSLPLERSVSQHSATSIRSTRSSTLRVKRSKLTSQPSSSASSIATSEDKSLTSFPSIPPDSPRPEHAFPLASPTASPPEPEPPATVRKISDTRPSPISLLGGLTTGSSAEQAARDALFEDSPISTHKIPGALHHANDEHIGRLIARHGAVALVRQVATDLAQRDAQIAQLRRKADERERALRKIILECGLSNLELETKLRAVESEVKTTRPGNRRNESGLSDLMSDAMQDTVIYNVFGQTEVNDATIRASSLAMPSNPDGRGTARGWKEFLWGGSSRKGSVPSSVNGDDLRPATLVRAQSSADRRPGLQDDLFSPPSEGGPFESVPPRTPSRASSIQSGPPGSRKPSTSVAASLMRLVAGGAINTRESGPNRGRSNSATHPQSTPRASSTSSAKTTQSSRAVSSQGGPKALMAMRRTGTNLNTPPPASAARTQPQDRWDAMLSPTNTTANRQESYGPVEMDAILPPETQPPTLTHIYNNYIGSEYLTDRFGFIYDQRRKKRQREAAQMARHLKQGSRAEMLSNGRPDLASPMIEEEEVPSPLSGEDRPDSPSSAEERAGEGRPKKWQDYLKLATFPTELLSHTPALSAPSLEVLEGGELGTKSPGLITADERGFVPVASTTTSVVDSDATPPVETDAAGGTVVRDDTEPVKLLLQHMGDLHDSLQREKAARWNEFLRKVRAERKRDGEAAAAAAAALAEARYERPAVNLPEAAFADGELIGITGLGIKGKVGRAKRTELRNLILGGIPVNLRAKVWSECSGANTLRVPGYYQDIIARSDKDDDPTAVSQIEMDINRTLTDNIFFRKGPGVSKLKEVLRAYARRNPEVGYCQGMNLIAANLLLIMPSAEDAFWILTSIIENILPSGYYDHSLLASRADQQVLRQYVADVLPKLSQHLDDLSIELEALTFQWFLSVFTDCLCAEALFRVWDVVFCMNDGSTFLFQVALALLKLNEPQLLLCDTPASVYTYINRQMTNHAISIDNMIKASDGLRKEVKREDVEARRDKAIQTEKDAARRREEMNAAKKTSKVNGNGNGHGSGHEDSEATTPGLDIRDPMPMEQEQT
ncbi:TBC domain-containing protein [Colletotrichum sublineola]|uniref:Putative TBC domain-containing protein n=1 Tax=Colletotrichum sublineola TaxID=1173701 RepID=A0A066XI39_COLSU|nr:TBC domain-containing protein [Colletotrichum sublineola]KDN67319.1 putative TBC domain-containing protein [Colletotrichum sublineola]